MVPAILLRVGSRLRLSTAAVRARPARPNHPEPGILQGVERLLDERVLEEEASGVAIRRATIRIAALVQRVPEHLATDGHATADEDPRDLAELDVRQAVSAELERSAVPDQDEARFDAVRPTAADGGQAHGGAVRSHGRPADVLQHAGKTVELSLLAESASLAKRLGEDQLAGAQVVQHVAEESPVSVDEVSSLGVARRRSVFIAAAVRTAEPLGQQRVFVVDQSSTRRRVDHAADVQVDDVTGWDCSRCRLITHH